MIKLQNNFTTQEQSKRLLELGVPADSADCIFTRFSRDEKWKRRFIEDIVSAQLFCNQDFYLPCWSVGRLMEIITICHLSRDGRFCFRKDMCESLVETICGFVKYGEMDFSKLED